MDITELLAFSVKHNASDLHLSAGVPPMIRVDGEVRKINIPALEHKEVNNLIYDIMNDKQRKDFEEQLETDFSFEIKDLARFRVNAFNQNRGAGAVFRTIPSKVLTLADLNAPHIFKQIAEYPRGLVLVTGPTGSGKSTTLAAMVDYINENRSDHILTIEDPIEFVHESKQALINQREVHKDTLSFDMALRSALREDPDVILVGEMRDLETIRLESLQAVISQTLLKKYGGGRIAAHEIMIGIPAIRNLIREDKIAQMYSAIQTGKIHGMQTLDQCLRDLISQGLVSYEDASQKAVDPKSLT
jgi:twitching motility protein PilT